MTDTETTTKDVPRYAVQNAVSDRRKAASKALAGAREEIIAGMALADIRVNGERVWQASYDRLAKALAALDDATEAITDLY